MRYKSVASLAYLFITQFSILRCSHRIPLTRSTTISGRLMPHTCAVEAHHYAYIGAAAGCCHPTIITRGSCNRLAIAYGRVGPLHGLVESVLHGLVPCPDQSAATCVPGCEQKLQKPFRHKFSVLCGRYPHFNFNDFYRLITADMYSTTGLNNNTVKPHECHGHFRQKHHHQQQQQPPHPCRAAPDLDLRTSPLHIRARVFCPSQQH